MVASTMASCRDAIRSMPMAMAGFALPTCPIAAPCWLSRRGSGRGRSIPSAELTDEALDPIFAEGDAIDLLLLGTGADIAAIPAAFRTRFREAGIGLDVMQTGAAARTYNILLAENRKVGAALIAVP